MSGKQKILVVRQGRAGDMVMITPALKQIFDGYPQAEVHLVTSGEGRRVMNGYHPRLSRIFLYTRKFPKTLIAGRQLVLQLKNEHYERVFLFETNPHYVKLMQGVAPRIHCITNLEPDIHYCVRCLEVVEEALPQEPPRGWVNLPVTDAGREKARDLLARNGIGESTFLVGLHPTHSGMDRPWGGRKKHRSWPQANFARMAVLLNEHARARDLDLKVIADILPEEKRLLGELVKHSGGALTLLSEPPDFDRYKGLLARMNLLVSPDTGPMHLAAALGTPLVALFSGKSPLDCGPYAPPEQYRIVQAKDMPEPDRGLAAIPPEKAFEACLHFLPGSGE